MGQADPGAIGATALRVAVRRAAHQLLDVPPVFDDPLALRIIGPTEQSKLRARIGAAERQWNNSLRAWIAARSRYAEDVLAEAVRTGVRQYVVLGAGLDTFAYRNPYPHLRVWEVDRAEAQAAKQQMLCDAGIGVPPGASFAAVDFTRQSLHQELCAHGFDQDSPAFFSWLGVTPFLDAAAFERTLAEIAPLAAHLVFDYAVSPQSLGEQDRFALELLSRRVAAAGEPYRLYFLPAQTFEGFTVLEDLGKDEINARYFDGRADGLTVQFTPSRLVSCVPSRTSDSRASSAHR